MGYLPIAPAVHALVKGPCLPKKKKVDGTIGPVDVGKEDETNMENAVRRFSPLKGARSATECQTWT